MKNFVYKVYIIIDSNNKVPGIRRKSPNSLSSKIFPLRRQTILGERTKKHPPDVPEGVEYSKPRQCSGRFFS